MSNYKTFLPLLICLLPFFGNGQTSTEDSLKTVIQSLPQDSNRVNALLKLSEMYLGTQPDTAIAYAIEAIELADDINFPKGLAYGLKNTGIGFYVKGDYQQTKNYWEQSLAIFQSINDQLGTSNLLSNIGAIYFNQGDDPKALEYYLNSLRAAEKINHKLRIVTALNNIGAVYLNLQANHDKALEYYSRALPISEEVGNLPAIATTAVNMGEIYWKRKLYDDALQLFEKALTAYNKAGLNPSYAQVNIGRVNASMGKHEEAIKYYEEALENAKKIDDKMQITIALNELGNSHLAIGKANDNEEFKADAFDYFTQAFEGSADISLQKEKETAAKGLYEFHKLEKNYSKALEYHEIYDVVKDSLLNAESIKGAALLGAEYEFEKKKKEIEDEAKDRLKEQRLVQYAIGSGLIVALIFIGILIQYYRLKRISSAEKFEAQRQLIIQDKLASLGQITAGIAHEIKNPLNFVKNFAEGSVELSQELKETLDENKGKLADDQYELMDEIIDDISKNSKIIEEHGLRADRVVKRMMEQARGDKGEPQMVNLNNLVDENIVLAYHGYRGNQSDFDVQIDKQYQEDLPLVELIPQDIGRVILNLFNNACYALYEKKKKTGLEFKPEISIKTSKKNNYAVIQLRDNGPGIKESVRNKIFQPFFTTKPTGQGNTGLGLSISYDLIVMGHDGQLEVDSKMGEYSEFIIRLPLK